MDSLEAAVSALTSGQADTALAAVSAAWLEYRLPVLAELAELYDAQAPSELGRQLSSLFTSRVDTSLEQLRALGPIDDPLFASFVLRALEAPPFLGPSARPLLIELLHAAARLSDPRLVERAPAIIETWTARVTPKPARVEGIALLQEVVQQIRDQRRPKAPQNLLAALVERLNRLAAPRRRAVELLAAVRANPDDDGPRLVFADFLLEQNDPRGEFIMLQLKRRDSGLDEAGQRREAELLKQHGKPWLGPLAAVLTFGKRYSSTTFERGFLCIADIQLSAGKKLDLVLDDPHWSTVEQLEGFFDPQLLMRAPLRALRRFGRHSWRTFSPEFLDGFARLKKTLPLREVYVHSDVEPASLGDVFPKLEQITVLLAERPTVADVTPWLQLTVARVHFFCYWPRPNGDNDIIPDLDALTAVLATASGTVAEIASATYQGVHCALRPDARGRYHVV